MSDIDDRARSWDAEISNVARNVSTQEKIGFVGTPSAGCVGEVISTTIDQQEFTLSQSQQTVISVTVTPGIWQVSGNLNMQNAGAGGWKQAWIGLNGSLVQDNSTLAMSSDDAHVSLQPYSRVYILTTAGTFGIVSRIENTTTKDMYACIEAARIA